jgi:hypothetical protein
MEKMNRPEVLGLVALSVIGCGGAAGPDTGVPSHPVASVSVSSVPLSASASVPSADPAAITVTGLAKVPAKVSSDGDLSEWGSLVPVPPKDGKPQPDGASHVAMALGPTAFYLVGSLRGAASHGVALGVREYTPEYPEVYFPARGNPTLGSAGCLGNEEQCEAISNGREAFIAEDSANFRRAYHIDEKGVSARDAKGDHPIDGAIFHAKAVQGGFDFEAQLPLAALPRLASHPVEQLLLIARPNELSDKLKDEDWIPVSFEPVALEPFGELRSKAYELASFNRSFAIGPSTYAYDPGDPNKIFRIGWDGMDSTAIRVAEHVLFRKLATDGDLDVGVLWGGSPALVVGRGGKFVGPTVLPIVLSSENVDIAVRPQGTVVFSFTSENVYDSSSDQHYVTANLSLFIVDHKGDIFDSSGAPEPTPEGPSGEPRPWAKVGASHTPDLGTVTVRGSVYTTQPWGSGPTTPRTITYRFDPKAGHYIVTKS